MRLNGIHHITCITADAPGNVDFYARVLGLRLVKQTVNFDAPEFYHLYYGDEHGTPGSILTFFEFPDAAPGRAGTGMVHCLRWRIGSRAALEFWAERLMQEGVALDVGAEGDTPPDNTLRFSDPEGLDLELAVVETDDAPLSAWASDIPREHALLGFDGVRVYVDDRETEDLLLTDTMGFTSIGPGAYSLQDGSRHASYTYDKPPLALGIMGAGAVHHIAWCDLDDEHAAWREHLRQAGANATPIIDREYFLSVYFREPRGVLFELATPSPGFAIDEEPAHLGEQLRLPPQHEHLREHLQHTLTPLVNPRVIEAVPTGQPAPSDVSPVS